MNKENEKEVLNNSKNSNESLLELTIYTYTKVISLGKGNLFGELALRNPQAVRTATIITSTSCHFSYLNKSTYNNCLKMNTELHLKEQLSFFINLPIFVDIPITSFYKKYYTNISKNYIIKNSFILKQGEKPSRICLLSKGLYVLMANLNISDLTDLIFFYLKKFKKYKSNLTQIEINNYKEITQSLLKNIEDEKKLIRDNIHFKNYYYTDTLIKINEIDCPDIMGYEELIGEDDLYAFSIQAKTIENIIYTIDYAFYLDLYHKNASVKKHHDDLIAIKIDLIIKRLVKIRNNSISNFFNYKIETDINAIISKELEDQKLSNSKLKRFLQFKSTKCNFYNKNEDSSIIKDIINDKEYFKDRSIFSRDKKIKKPEKLNIFTAYRSCLLKNNSKGKKTFKKLILPKEQLSKKKQKRYLFDFDLDNNKKEEKLNKTTYKQLLTEENKHKSINDKLKNINIDIDDNKIINSNNLVNLLPIYNLRKRLKTEYSKIKYNQKPFTDNSKEIKGRKINNSIRCYFEKKINPSNSLILKIIKKKRQKIKSENNKLNNKEKESIELLSSDIENNNNMEMTSSINRNEKLYKYFYFKGNKRFSTPNNFQLNLLLLNNKSINFTNKDLFFHNSLKLLTQKTQTIKNIKFSKKKFLSQPKSPNNEIINNNNKKNSKENYIFKRQTYYKKNLTRMKLFYGLDKK